METLNNNTTTSNEVKEVKDVKETKKSKTTKEVKPKKEKVQKERKHKFNFPKAIHKVEENVGTGHLWDNVLEYRVWNDSTYKSFSDYNEALNETQNNTLKISVLIEQLPNHWIKETENGITIGTEHRTTEWKAEMLIGTKYSLPRLKWIYLKLVKDTAKETLNKLIANLPTKNKKAEQ